MKWTTLVLLLGFATVGCSTARADGFDFIFNGISHDALQDENDNQPGQFTGQFLGLPANGTGFPTEIVITSAPPLFGNFPTDIFDNPNLTVTDSGSGFTVVNGSITGFSGAISFQPTGYGGQQVSGSLVFDDPVTFQDNGFNAPSFTSDKGIAAFTFTPLATNVVPEPGTWALLLLGLAGLVAVRRHVFKLVT